MPRPRPPHLHRERNRHGDVVWYVRRRHGRRVRLRAEYGSPEFWAEYRAALEGAPTISKTVKPHTMAWGVQKYMAHSAWKNFAPATRRQREHILRSVTETAGAEPLSTIDQAAIKKGKERRSGHPHSANNFLKTMRGFFAWALEEGHVKTDPAKGVKLFKGENEAVGFHTWTEEEVALFEDRWPIGTRERLALDLLLFTGLRRGDVVRLGRQHVRDGLISIRTEKRAGEGEIHLPMLDVLANTISKSVTGDLTFLTTARGTAFVKESFGNWFRSACKAAGVPGSAHGLRKAGATRAAENGATDRQLMALFGWSTGKMAHHYTHAADTKRLARDAVELLRPARKQNEKRPHLKPGAGRKAKLSKKAGA